MSAYGIFVLVLCYISPRYFDTVGWVFWPVQTVSHITYIVLVGTLNTAQSIIHYYMMPCNLCCMVKTKTMVKWVEKVGQGCLKVLEKFVNIPPSKDLRDTCVIWIVIWWQCVSATVGFELVYMDDFIDELLHDERSCDVILPRIQVKYTCNQTHKIRRCSNVFLRWMKEYAKAALRDIWWRFVMSYIYRLHYALCQISSSLQLAQSCSKHHLTLFLFEHLFL